MKAVCTQKFFWPVKDAPTETYRPGAPLEGAVAEFAVAQGYARDLAPPPAPVVETAPPADAPPADAQAENSATAELPVEAPPADAETDHGAPRRRGRA